MSIDLYYLNSRRARAYGKAKCRPSVAKLHLAHEDDVKDGCAVGMWYLYCAAEITGYPSTWKAG